MADAQTLPTPSQSTKVGVNQMFIHGRIERVSKFKGDVNTIVVTPAPDAYSKPSLMKIISPALLGQKGEEVRVLCSYNGYSNEYEVRDEEGDKRTVYDVRGCFIAV